jgi:hypothetical protein
VRKKIAAWTLCLVLGFSLYMTFRPHPIDKRAVVLARLRHEDAELDAALGRVNDTLLDLDDQNQNVIRIQAEVHETEQDAQEIK